MSVLKTNRIVGLDDPTHVDMPSGGLGGISGIDAVSEKIVMRPPRAVGIIRQALGTNAFHTGPLGLNSTMLFSPTWEIPGSTFQSPVNPQGGPHPPGTFTDVTAPELLGFELQPFFSSRLVYRLDKPSRVMFLASMVFTSSGSASFRPRILVRKNGEDIGLESPSYPDVVPTVPMTPSTALFQFSVLFEKDGDYINFHIQNLLSGNGSLTITSFQLPFYKYQ